MYLTVVTAQWLQFIGRLPWRDQCHSPCLHACAWVMAIVAPIHRGAHHHVLPPPRAFVPPARKPRPPARPPLSSTPPVASFPTLAWAEPTGIRCSFPRRGTASQRPARASTLPTTLRAPGSAARRTTGAERWCGSLNETDARSRCRHRRHRLRRHRPCRCRHSPRGVGRSRCSPVPTAPTAPRSRSAGQTSSTVTFARRILGCWVPRPRSGWSVAPTCLLSLPARGLTPMALLPPPPAPQLWACRGYGNFDIVLDLSRITQLFTTPHAPCGAFCGVPRPEPDADWGV